MTPAGFLKLIGFDLKAFEAKVEETREARHAHTAPSDEPLSWDTRGKCVTLDHAVMAAHLMTEKLIFGGFRSIVDQLLRVIGTKLENKITDLAESLVAEITGAWKKNVAFAVDLGQVYNDNFQQESKERQIRKDSLDAQRSLWKNALAQRKSKRKTRRVLTRHASPKQRKANKKWRNPSAAS